MFFLLHQSANVYLRRSSWYEYMAVPRRLTVMYVFLMTKNPIKVKMIVTRSIEDNQLTQTDDLSPGRYKSRCLCKPKFHSLLTSTRHSSAFWCTVEDSDHIVLYVKSPSTPQLCLYLTINSSSCHPLTHPPWHLTSNTIWWVVQVMKLFCCTL